MKVCSNKTGHWYHIAWKCEHCDDLVLSLDSPNLHVLETDKNFVVPHKKGEEH